MLPSRLFYWEGIIFITIALLFIDTDCSPNATGDEFLEFALSKSVSDEGPLHKHKSKFVKVRTTTANRAAVEEILGNPEVMGRLTDVKVVDEVCFVCFPFVFFVSDRKL